VTKTTFDESIEAQEGKADMVDYSERVCVAGREVAARIRRLAGVGHEDDQFDGMGGPYVGLRALLQGLADTVVAIVDQEELSRQRMFETQASMLESLRGDLRAHRAGSGTVSLEDYIRGEVKVAVAALRDLGRACLHLDTAAAMVTEPDLEPGRDPERDAVGQWTELESELAKVLEYARGDLVAAR
jgi:hypothetical protein